MAQDSVKVRVSFVCEVRDEGMACGDYDAEEVIEEALENMVHDTNNQFTHLNIRSLKVVEE